MLKTKENIKKGTNKNKNVSNKTKIKEGKQSAEKINTGSNNSSVNSSFSKMKDKIKNKSKRNSKSNYSKKDKQLKINSDLIKNQYKIIKDFLTPILKEENARQLVLCYSKKMKNSQKPSFIRDRNCSLNNRSILDYSFVNENSNKTKIPLFQIMFPNQYKKHIEKKNKDIIDKGKRAVRHMSAPNIKITNNKKYRRGSMPRINNKNNLLNNIQNNNIDKKNKNKNKSDNIINTINSKSSKKIVRAKTPPLYLRLKDVQSKHEEQIEKLKKKYEYNNNNNNNNNSNYSSSLNDTSKTRNKAKSPHNFEKWYNYEKTWQKLKNIKINMLRNELEENKMFINQSVKDEETFKPKINKKSENLVNKKYDGDFYLRLQAFQNNKIKKRKMLQEKLKPNFKPYVNTNYQIRSEYYDYMKYDQKLINRDFNIFFENF